MSALPLAGTHCFIDAFLEDGQDLRPAISEKVEELGGTVSKRFSPKLVSHLVWQNGDRKRLAKAKTDGNVYVVSSEFIINCFNEKCHLPENQYAINWDSDEKIEKRKRLNGFNTSSRDVERLASPGNSCFHSSQNEKSCSDVETVKKLRCAKPRGHRGLLNESILENPFDTESAHGLAKVNAHKLSSPLKSTSRPGHWSLKTRCNARLLPSSGDESESTHCTARDRSHSVETDIDSVVHSPKNIGRIRKLRAPSSDSSDMTRSYKSSPTFSSLHDSDLLLNLASVAAAENPLKLEEFKVSDICKSNTYPKSLKKSTSENSHRNVNHAASKDNDLREEIDDNKIMNTSNETVKQVNPCLNQSEKPQKEAFEKYTITSNESNQDSVNKNVTHPNDSKTFPGKNKNSSNGKGALAPRSSSSVKVKSSCSKYSLNPQKTIMYESGNSSNPNKVEVKISLSPTGEQNHVLNQEISLELIENCNIKKLNVEDNDCRRNDEISGCQISFSGLDVDSKLQLISIADGLLTGPQDEIVEGNDSAKCTHLVVPEENPRRTLKVLFALCRGANILTPRWIYDCYAEQRWLNPAGYTSLHFESGVQNSRSTLLSGERIFIRRSIASKTLPPMPILSELLSLVGAEISTSSRGATLHLVETTLAKSFSRKKAYDQHTVTWNWLVDSIEKGVVQDKSAYEIVC